MTLSVSEVVMVSSLLLNIIIAVVGATWGVAKIKSAVGEAIEEHREKFAATVKGVDEKFDRELDATARSFGETAKAIREKIQEVEIYIRDNYVTKLDMKMYREAFEGTIDRFEHSVGSRLTDIHDRLERMEGKLDDVKSAQ
jgi:hypothetical protein